MKLQKQVHIFLTSLLFFSAYYPLASYGEEKLDTQHGPSSSQDHEKEYDRFLLQLRLGSMGSTGNGANLATETGGVSAGAIFGYRFNRNILGNVFYDSTFSTNGFHFNAASLLGLGGDYVFNPYDETRFFLGLKTGYIDVSSIFVALVPAGAGSFTSWFAGPKFGMLIDVSDRWSFGGDVDLLWVKGTSAHGETLIGPTSLDISDFMIFNFSLTVAYSF